MDIQALLQNMWELRNPFRFTNNEKLLFYELLALAYHQNSDYAVQCSNEDLCKLINVDIATLRRARNKLCKANLISYDAGKSRRDIGLYTLLIAPNMLPKVIPDVIPDVIPKVTPHNITAGEGSAIRGVPKVIPKVIPDVIPKTLPIPPLIEEVEAYCLERQNKVNPQHFFDYYSANGWKVGKNKMKDWKASVRTWEQNKMKYEKDRTNNSSPKDYSKHF